MREQEGIPDSRERMQGRDRSQISITCTFILVKVPWIPEGPLWLQGSVLMVFNNPFALKPFNNTVGHPGININKGDILVHPIILSTCVCHHQHFQGLLVIFYCFHWQFKAATWVSDFNVRWPPAWQSVRHEQNCSSTVKKPNPSDRFLTLKENLQN